MKGQPVVPTLRSRRAAPYGFAGPGIAVIALVYLYPLIAVLVDSLRSQAARGLTLTNYREVLSDPVFRTSIENNAKFLVCVPVLLVVGVVLALLLYEQPLGWRIHRALIFLPYVIAIPVAGIAFSQVFAYRGPLNTALLKAHLIGSRIDWLGQPRTGLLAIGFVIVWRELGFVVVLLLARLTAIDPSLLEAASLDGARPWQVHRYITIPQLASTLSFLALIEVITMLSWIFSYVYTMTGGGPGNATSVVELYIYNRAIVFNAPALASALAICLLVLVGSLVTLQLAIRSRTEVAS